MLTAAQHAAVITAVGVIFPKLVLAHANLNAEQSNAVLGLSMLALGIATLLQTQRLGGIGSGFLAPVVFTAAYLAPAINAAEEGGLPLVFGMTIFAGLCEVALAPLLRLLRPFLPTEIAGLAVLMIGIILGTLGFRLIFGSRPHPTWSPTQPASGSV